MDVIQFEHMHIRRWSYHDLMPSKKTQRLWPGENDSLTVQWRNMKHLDRDVTQNYRLHGCRSLGD